MPERKRFFSIDVFPKELHVDCVRDNKNVFFFITFPPLFSASIYVLCYGEYGKWVESIDVEVIKRNWTQSAEEIVILVRGCS